MNEVEYKKCPNCGEIIKKNAIYCRFCKRDIIEKNNGINKNAKVEENKKDEIGVSAQYKQCPHCGKRILINAVFCNYCGKKIISNKIPISTNVIIIFFIILLILSIIASIILTKVLSNKNVSESQHSSVDFQETVVVPNQELEVLEKADNEMILDITKDFFHTLQRIVSGENIVYSYFFINNPYIGSISSYPSGGYNIDFFQKAFKETNRIELMNEITLNDIAVTGNTATSNYSYISYDYSGTNKWEIVLTFKKIDNKWLIDTYKWRKIR